MFGNRLLELRKSRGLTQIQVANKLNLTREQISNYERSKREPDFETLQKLANFFNVSVDYLLGNSNDKSKQYYESSETDNPDNNVKLIASHIDDDVTEEDMEDILKYIELIKKSKK